MSVTQLNSTNFEKEVVKSDIPVIVDFWASWCGPCKMMAPVFEELSSEYDGKVKFAKLSVEEERQLAMQHHINSIPTLVMFKNGKEMDRIMGFAPKEVLEQQIDNMIQ